MTTTTDTYTDYPAWRFLEDLGKARPADALRSAVRALYRDAVDAGGYRRPLTRNHFYRALRDLGATETKTRAGVVLVLPAEPTRTCRICSAAFRSYDPSRTECGPVECREWADAMPVGPEMFKVGGPTPDGPEGEVIEWMRSKVHRDQPARVPPSSVLQMLEYELPRLAGKFSLRDVTRLGDRVFGIRASTGWRNILL